MMRHCEPRRVDGRPLRVCWTLSPGQMPILALLVWASLAGVSATASGAAGRLEHLAHLEGRTVAAIEVEGNRTTRTYVVLRELRTQVGRPLDLEVLGADLQRLDNLDIFSSLRVEAAEARGLARGLNLTLRVREVPFVVPYVTYDVSDQDGWSFGPAIKSGNLLGRDIYAAGYALFGGRTTFLLDATNPWMFGNHVSLDLDLYRIERENEQDEFRERVFELSPRLGTYLGERGRAAFGVGYVRVEADLPGHTLSPDRVDELYRVKASAGYDSRDAWGNPHRGWLNEVEAIRTGGPLPGDGDYWTLNLDGRRFQPVGEHTLALAGLLTLQSGQVGRDVPEYMDFHLGGSNSLRGHLLNELGQVQFGRNQLLTTAEYRAVLLEPREFELLGLSADLGLAGALFHDAGMAWDRGEQVEWGRLEHGFGAGLRLLMPWVDMTRFDVGFDRHGNWHVHVASFSKMRLQRLRLR